MKQVTSVVFKNSKRRERISKTGKKGSFLSFLSFVIVFGALAGIMIWASIYVTNRLKEFEQTYAFVNLMLFANFGVLFIKSIFETLNVLYFSKDLKLLLRMPIRSEDIVHAKLLKMITSEYDMEVIMLGIPMIVYGIMTGVSFQFYLYALIVLLILPIIPICIVSTVIALIMRFTNFIKNKSRVMYIGIIAGFIIINIISSMFGGQGLSTSNFEEAITKENGLAIEIANNFKLIIPIMNSLQNYNNVEGVKNILGYCFGSIIVYIISIMIISPIYLKGAIGTIVNGNRKLVKEKIDLNLKDFKKRTPKKAYLWKEYILIKRSPIFFIECIFMPIVFSVIVLLIAVSMAGFTDHFGYDMIKEITDRANMSWGAGVFLSISQVFYMINFASIIAISKEERWAILGKYIPIKLSRQINMKLLIGKISNFISSIAVVLWYYICTRNIIHTIFIFLIGVGLNSIGEKVKIFIDLKNPKIDWDNEYTMMKQNTNVMFELFYTILIIFAVVGFGFIVPNIDVYLIIMTIIILIINLAINKYIYDNDNKIYENLY